MHPNKIINEDLDDICSANIDWSRFEGRTILVTGANGFLPAYIIETLLHLQQVGIIHDLTVIALVRNKIKAELKFRHHLANKSLLFLVQDVSETIRVEQGIDYIIHAASQASPKYYGIDPVGTLKANTLGTYNVLELAREKNVERVLYFSSGEVYGTLSADVEYIKESDYGYLDPVSVRACYGESKRMGENMCASWAAQYGIPVSIVRPFHTYGPGMALDDGRVFADFVRNIVKNEDIVINSDGCAVRAFCYLSDAAKAFFTILLEGKNGEAYNMGNPGAAICIADLANVLVEIFPEKGLKVVFKKRSNSDYLQSPICSNIPDDTKLRQLGWEPTTSIKMGFERTINSYL